MINPWALSFVGGIGVDRDTAAAPLDDRVEFRTRAQVRALSGHDRWDRRRDTRERAFTVAGINLPDGWGGTHAGRREA